MLGRPKLFSRLGKDPARLAELAVERKDWTAAAEYFSTTGQHHRAAEFFATAGNEKKALLEAFRASLGAKAVIDPDSTIEQAAELLVSTGYRKEAVALFELAGAFHQAAKVALKSGQTFRAGQCFEKAKLWTRAATCYEKAGHPNEALRILGLEARRLRQVLQRLPNSLSQQHLRRVVAKREQILSRLGRQEESAAAPSSPFDSQLTPSSADLARPENSVLGPASPLPAPVDSPDEAQPIGLVVGQIVGDRYRIFDTYDRFGQPSYKAADRQVGEIVEIRAHPFPCAQLPARGVENRDLAISQTLDHPCILRVHDARCIDASFYITRELAEGERLDRRLQAGPMRRQGPLTLVEIKAIAGCIATALRQAHGAGLLHRSLRPSNILLTSEGAKVMDFGLSGFEAFSVRCKSLPHRAFFSPEQLLGKDLDPRSDLYSLGALILAMLKGSVSIADRGDIGSDTGGDTGSAVAIALPAPKTYRPGLPISWEVLLRRLLAPAPEARFSAAEALCRSLATLAESERPEPGSGDAL